MRTIIVGGGEIGFALSRQLSGDHEIPRGDTRLVAGDKIILMGTPEAMTAAARAQRASAPFSSSRSSAEETSASARAAPRLDARHRRWVIERDAARRDACRLTAPGARPQRRRHRSGALMPRRSGGATLVSVIDNDERNLLRRSSRASSRRTLHSRGVLPVGLGGRVALDDVMRSIFVFFLFACWCSPNDDSRHRPRRGYHAGLTAFIACWQWPGFGAVGPMGTSATSTRCRKSC
jgi:hypothetical protein